MIRWLHTLLLLLPSIAAGQEWREFNKWPDGAETGYRPDSLQLGNDKSGIPFVGLTWRYVKAGGTSVHLKVVRAVDCRSGQGELVSLSMSGALLFRVDFAFGSGNAGSDMAQLMCAALEFTEKGGLPNAVPWAAIEGSIKRGR